jgi:hypothetical protein
MHAESFRQILLDSPAAGSANGETRQTFPRAPRFVIRVMALFVSVIFSWQLKGPFSELTHIRGARCELPDRDAP